MSKRVLDDRLILAVKAVYSTGVFTYAEVGKMFYISRNTVRRYMDVEPDAAEVQKANRAAKQGR
jgi:response regulator of citrate/malate metabolism